MFSPDERAQLTAQALRQWQEVQRQLTTVTPLTVCEHAWDRLYLASIHIQPD